MIAPRRICTIFHTRAHPFFPFLEVTVEEWSYSELLTWPDIIWPDGGWLGCGDGWLDGCVGGDGRIDEFWKNI